LNRGEHLILQQQEQTALFELVLSPTNKKVFIHDSFDLSLEGEEESNISIICSNSYQTSSEVPIKKRFRYWRGNEIRNYDKSRLRDIFSKIKIIYNGTTKFTVNNIVNNFRTTNF
jgi:hypothetical protein